MGLKFLQTAFNSTGFRQLAMKRAWYCIIRIFFFWVWAKLWVVTEGHYCYPVAPRASDSANVYKNKRGKMPAWVGSCGILAFGCCSGVHVPFGSRSGFRARVWAVCEKLGARSGGIERVVRERNSLLSPLPLRGCISPFFPVISD